MSEVIYLVEGTSGSKHLFQKAYTVFNMLKMYVLLSLHPLCPSDTDRDLQVQGLLYITWQVESWLLNPWFNVLYNLYNISMVTGVTFSDVSGSVVLISGERWSRGRAPDCQSRDSGSIPPTTVSKLRQFRSPHICLCLLEETKSRWSFICQGK